MAAVERDRDRLSRWWAGQRLDGQNLLLQFRAHPQGSPTRRLDRRRFVQRKEFRHQRRRAAISGQAPHFDENALVFSRATIRHDLSQRANDPARGHSTAAGIETRRLDLHDPEQGRQLPSAPVLNGATGAAMRTNPPMITIFIGLACRFPPRIDPGFPFRTDPSLMMICGSGVRQVSRFLLGGFSGLRRAVFEAEAVISGFEDVAAMGEAVEQRRRHLGIAEHARPFAEA